MIVTIPGFGDVKIRMGESDLAVVRQIFIDGDYDTKCFSQDEWLNNRYNEICASGTPVIIDAGANIGASSVWFARKYPKAKVIAVEPDRTNVECCRANTSSLNNVFVVESAIGATSGMVELINPFGASWAIQTRRSDSSSSGVPVHSIRELTAMVDGGHLFIVKIDIEGFESDLFIENTQWIDEVSLVIIEPHDWMLPGKKSSKTFQRSLAAHDFEILIRGENLLYFRANLASR